MAVCSNCFLLSSMDAFAIAVISSWLFIFCSSNKSSGANWSLARLNASCFSLVIFSIPLWRLPPVPSASCRYADRKLCSVSSIASLRPRSRCLSESAFESWFLYSMAKRLSLSRILSWRFFVILTLISFSKIFISSGRAITTPISNARTILGNAIIICLRRDTPYFRMVETRKRSKLKMISPQMIANPIVHIQFSNTV